MAPTATAASKRKGATSAEKSQAGRQSKPDSSTRWPVHVTVGLAALAGLAALGGYHWVSGNRQAPERQSPQNRRPAVAATAPLWATVDKLPGLLKANRTCHKADAQGVCNLPRLANRCARFVIDGAIPMDKAQELQKMMQWLVDEAWGAGSGPPSVVDLHAGSISYKDKFVDLAALMDFKQVKFTDAQIEAYNEVRRSIRGLVADFFGLPEEALLQDMTFFSHINASKAAQTTHDEYWHKHTDTEQYGTFAYTTLLYLSTVHEDFEGGSFVFDDAAKPVAVAPRFGRLVVFTSDAENDHHVEEVTRGVRIALTSAFTCNLEKAKSIEAFPENFAKRAAEKAAQEAA